MFSMPSNGVPSVSWHGHVGTDAPRDRYLSHSIGPACLFGHTHVEYPIWFMTPHNHVPHRQNTQSDRMFISFDSHPYGVDTNPTVYGWLHPPLSTCTRCGHGCVIISGTQLASLLHGCLTQVYGVVCLLPHASHMGLCAVCLLRVAWMQNTQSDRSSFTPARRCASYGPRCLVLTSFAGAQRIILLSGSSVTGSCSTLGGGSMFVTWFSIACRDHRVWLTPSNP